MTHFYHVGLIRGGYDLAIWSEVSTEEDPLDVINWEIIASVRVETAGGPIVAFDTKEAGSDLHIATQQEDGRVRYHVHDPGTAAFTISNFPVYIRGDVFSATGQEGQPLTPVVGIGVRADGDVLIGFAVGRPQEGDQTNNVDRDMPDHMAVFMRTTGAFTQIGSTGLWTNFREHGTGLTVVGPATDDRITFASRVTKAEFYFQEDKDDGNLSDQFGSTGTGTGRLSQMFQFDEAVTVPSIKLEINRNNSPTDAIRVRIETDTAGLPSGSTVTNGTSNTIAAADLDILGGSHLQEFIFATPPSLSATTDYHLIIERTGSLNSSNNYDVKVDLSPLSNPYPRGNMAEWDSTNGWVDIPTNYMFFEVIAEVALAIKSVSSTDVLSSKVNLDTDVDIASYILGRGVIDNSTPGEVYIPYIDADDNVSVADFTSAADPTGDITITTGISDVDVLGHSRSNRRSFESASAGTGDQLGTNANEKKASSFILDQDVEVSSIEVEVSKSGSPTDGLELEIREDSGGDPTGITLLLPVRS